ncbi:MAG: glycosyltransferase family 4 protein [Desulfobacteraceae bacterium]|nr:glycosyltransferase family 4 protein [Desulfobacteraceae bacterium]
MPAVPDRPLRICLLSYRSNPHCGGQGVYVKHLSRSLTGLGHQVHVVSGPPIPDVDKGIHLHPIPGLDLYNPENPFRTPSLGELKNPVNLMEWVSVSTQGFPEPFTFGIRARRYVIKNKDKYDIVHDNQSLSYGVWSIQKRLPTVTTIHHPITVDRDIAVTAEKNFLKKIKHLRWYSFTRMQKKVARTLSKIITVSKFARNDIVNEFGLSPGRFHIVPNGIDTERFHPLAGIERVPGRLIVTNSADTPLKGLGFLLKAIAIVKRSHPVHLVIVGNPQRNGYVRQAINDLGLAAAVDITGRIPQAEFIRQYARASAAVIPSIYEGFGLPAGEAMACRVPVISTTGGALPEVVGDAGLLVPPADPTALANAIKVILDSPDYADKLAEKGFRRVHSHFSWPVAAEKTLAVYAEAIRDHHKF